MLTCFNFTHKMNLTVDISLILRWRVGCVLFTRLYWQYQSFPGIKQYIFKPHIRRKSTYILKPNLIYVFFVVVLSSFWLYQKLFKWKKLRTMWISQAFTMFPKGPPTLIVNLHNCQPLTKRLLIYHPRRRRKSPIRWCFQRQCLLTQWLQMGKFRLYLYMVE